MKKFRQYLLFFLYPFSILNIIIETVEPEQNVSDDIFGFTVTHKEYSMLRLTITEHKPKPCSLAAIIGKASQLYNKPITSKETLMDALESSQELKTMLAVHIDEKILTPKMVFYGTLMLLSSLLMDTPTPLNQTTLSVMLIISSIYALTAAIQKLEIIKLFNLRVFTEF